MSSNHRPLPADKVVCGSCGLVRARTVCQPVRILSDGSVKRWRCLWCNDDLCRRAQNAGIPFIGQNVTTIELSKGQAPVSPIKIVGG
jgi:hypothetical protein